MGMHEVHGNGAVPAGAPRAADEKFVNDAYVPDFSDLAARAGLSADALAGDRISIPTKLFRLLMTLQLRQLPFNDEAYAKANPDVAEAYEKGEVSSLFEHYIGTGWFENRPRGWHYVDERWYQQRYYDLAVAQRAGKVSNLSEHFYLTGRREGRVASARQLAAKEEWDRVLKPDEKPDE